MAVANERMLDHPIISVYLIMSDYPRQGIQSAERPESGHSRPAGTFDTMPGLSAGTDGIQLSANSAQTQRSSALRPDAAPDLTVQCRRWKSSPQFSRLDSPPRSGGI